MAATTTAPAAVLTAEEQALIDSFRAKANTEAANNAYGTPILTGLLERAPITVSSTVPKAGLPWCGAAETIRITLPNGALFSLKVMGSALNDIARAMAVTG